MYTNVSTMYNFYAYQLYVLLLDVQLKDGSSCTSRNMSLEDKIHMIEDTFN
jgi:hypothetical protein